jgi:ubiquinone/menaquinone biosynthesis C-methylase UbiE
MREKIQKMVPTICLSADIYQRYKFVSDLIRKNKCDNVLDVGSGPMPHIKKFLKDRKCTTLDLHHGDIKGDALEIPLKSDSIDAVVSVSVLQYIPRRDRLKFIRESLRVARKCVIISTAIKSNQLIWMSKEGDKIYKKIYGKRNRWLWQHTEEKLPTEEEVLGILKKINKELDVKVYPNGYLKRWWMMLKINFRLLNGAWVVFHPFINMVHNLLFYRFDNRNPSFQKVFLIKKK